MDTPSNHEVTQLLKAGSGGDAQALEKLTPLVYRQLHQIAQRYMGGERSGHTLQTTALVNEVYLRLVDCRQVNWQDRAHFLAVSAILDAAHFDRFCPLARLFETRRRRSSHFFGRCSVGVQ